MQPSNGVIADLNREHTLQDLAAALARVHGDGLFLACRLSEMVGILSLLGYHKRLNGLVSVDRVEISRAIAVGNKARLIVARVPFGAAGAVPLTRSHRLKID